MITCKECYCQFLAITECVDAKSTAQHIKILELKFSLFSSAPSQGACPFPSSSLTMPLVALKSLFWYFHLKSKEADKRAEFLGYSAPFFLIKTSM